MTDRSDTPAASPPVDEAAGHIRGSSVFAVGRVASLALTLATQVLIVRALTKQDYGAFAYGLAIVVFARTLVSAGHNDVQSRFLAIYEERRDYPRLFGTMVMEAGTIVVLSALMFAVFLLSREWIGTTLVGDPSVIPVLGVLLFLAPLEALDRLFESIFAVLSRPRAIFFRKYLVTPGLRLLVVVALVLSGADVLFLAIGYVAATALGLLLYLTLFVRTLRERGWLRHPAWRRIVLPFREVFTFAFPLLSGEVVNLSITTVSVVLLGYYATTTDVASYRAVYPAARLNQLVLWTFAVLFMPLAARLFARDDRAGIRDAYWRSALWVTVATFPIFAATVPLAATTTVTLFGEAYRDSAVVLAVLSLGYYVNAALGFNVLLLQTVGRLGWLVKVNGTVALLNIALAFALVPRWGAVGVAVANCVTLIAQNILNQIGLGRAIGIRVFGAQGLPVYGMVTLAGAALWGFQQLARPHVALALPVAAAVSLLLLVAARRHLHISETFPEVTRVPILRRLLAD